MKILFYDKHVKFNNPSYAVRLLNELKKYKHEIYVIVGDSHAIRSSPISLENLININFSEIYSDFRFKFINNLDEVNSILNDYKPDLFLSDFGLINFERDVLKLVKSKKIRDIGMDMVSSEILVYTRNHRFPLHLIHQIKGYFEVINYYSDRFFNRKLVSSLGSSSLDNKPLSNLITLKGNFFQDSLVKKYSKFRFPVTGSIQFDALVENKESRKIFKKLSVDENSPIVIMAPSPKEENFIDHTFIYNTCEAIKKKSNFQLFIIPHPSDRVFHPKRFENLAGRLLSSIDFYKLLPHAQALITPSSTVGLEAAFCRVPVLGSDIYRDINWEFPYFKNGFNVGMKVNEKNIVNIITEIIDRKISFDFQPFINYMCYKDDGLSYKRLAFVIDKYLSHVS